MQAITRNKYGEGTAYYLGCMTDDNTLYKVIKVLLEVQVLNYLVTVIR